MISIIGLCIAPFTAMGGEQFIRIFIFKAANFNINGLNQPLQLLSDRSCQLAQASHVSISVKNNQLICNGQSIGKKIIISNAKQEYNVNNIPLSGQLTIATISKNQAHLIIKMPFERYLIGVLQGEVPLSWPADTLKAQAIASRTYALSRIRERQHGHHDFDVYASIQSQRFKHMRHYDSRARSAITDTKHLVLFKDNGLYPVFFHSNCGGQTELAHNVWPGQHGPPSIPDPYCKHAKNNSWTYQISKSSFIQTLAPTGHHINDIQSIFVTELSDSPRIAHLLIEDIDQLHMIPAVLLRKTLGYSNFKSTWFSVALRNDTLVFTGKGWGHGVGLCQWGAKKMGLLKKNFQEILHHYFPGATIQAY